MDLSPIYPLESQRENGITVDVLSLQQVDALDTAEVNVLLPPAKEPTVPDRKGLASGADEYSGRRRVIDEKEAGGDCGQTEPDPKEDLPDRKAPARACDCGDNPRSANNAEESSEDPEATG